jgi:hypothetical protein
MGRDELIANTALYGGTLATCSAAPAAYSTESTMLLIFSAVGAIAAVAGLMYTVWNGNRNFQLAREEYELKRLELRDESHKQYSQPQPDSA